MDYIKQACRVFASDSKTLKSVVKKENWVKPFLTIIGISFLMTILDVSLFQSIILVAITILLAFISAGSLHISLLFFKGKASFKQTLTVNFNIQLLPSIVFAGLALLSLVISYVNMLAGEIIAIFAAILILFYIPWFIIIMTISLSEIHKVPLTKSYLSQLISLLVTGFVGLIFFSIYIYFFLLPDPMVQQLLLAQGLN
ncbi:MAG: hypothetical protein VX028_04145 [Nanoarchaeota archaeon]|nr:hypothetical protein [Nanoarchaeota archaeon]